MSTAAAAVVSPSPPPPPAPPLPPPPNLDVHYQANRRVPYREALVWQRWKQRQLYNIADANVDATASADDAAPRPADALFLVEHDPVFTLGRRSTLDNRRFDPDRSPHDLVRVERGGEVTWHGPGQLVGYPIVALGGRKKDLHWFLRQIEQVVIDVLATFGLEGRRDDAGTGVWVGDNKIAAIGLSASKWVSMHGFSINVDPDLDDFRRIVPCGIEGRGVTSLVAEGATLGSLLGCAGGETTAVDVVAQETARQFAAVFGQPDGSVRLCPYPDRDAVTRDCGGDAIWSEGTLPVRREGC